MIEVRCGKDDGARVTKDMRTILAEAYCAPGCERYFALCLHELVAKGAIDVGLVRRFFEACEKGDGPKVEKR